MYSSVFVFLVLSKAFLCQNFVKYITGGKQKIAPINKMAAIPSVWILFLILAKLQQHFVLKFWITPICSVWIFIDGKLFVCRGTTPRGDGQYRRRLPSTGVLVHHGRHMPTNINTNINNNISNNINNSNNSKVDNSNYQAIESRSLLDVTRQPLHWATSTLTSTTSTSRSTSKMPQ